MRVCDVTFSGCATARKCCEVSYCRLETMCSVWVCDVHWTGRSRETGYLKSRSRNKKGWAPLTLGTACFAYDRTVIHQRRVEKSAFQDQSEKTSVWIIKWTTLLGIFCKMSFTPTVTSCYHVHADAHLSVALLCYLGVETSLLTVSCIE